MDAAVPRLHFEKEAWGARHVAVAMSARLAGSFPTMTRHPGLVIRPLAAHEPVPGAKIIISIYPCISMCSQVKYHRNDPTPFPIGLAIIAGTSRGSVTRTGTAHFCRPFFLLVRLCRRICSLVATSCTDVSCTNL